MTSYVHNDVRDGHVPLTSDLQRLPVGNSHACPQESKQHRHHRQGKKTILAAGHGEDGLKEDWRPRTLTLSNFFPPINDALKVLAHMHLLSQVQTVGHQTVGVKKSPYARGRGGGTGIGIERFRVRNPVRTVTFPPASPLLSLMLTGSTSRPSDEIVASILLLVPVACIYLDV